MPDDEKKPPPRGRLTMCDDTTCARHIWLCNLAHKAERLFSHWHSADDDH